MTTDRQVYVVDGDDRPVERLRSALSGVAVESVTVGEVMVRLCRSAVDCLVVPVDLAETEPEHVVHAATGMFPDLPIVAFGSGSPEMEGAVTVAADSVGGEAVVTAVRDVLEANPEPQSARPPSRVEALVSSMFEGFPAHLYAKDREARHLLTSDTMYAPADLLGLTDMETLSGDETFDVPNYSDDRRVIEDGESVLQVDEYADSVDQHLRTSKVPWRDSSGEILGLVGITQDVTDMQETTEKLRQRNRRLRKVALMTAHELRNEIQVVSGQLSRIDAEGEGVEQMDESLDRVAGVAAEANETGFGLYIASQVADEQGWSLSVSNDDGARVDVVGIEAAAE